MWGDPGEHQLTFVQSLADQAEVELLEVAKAAVEEFRRARRRAGREISGLDKCDRKPTGRRIEGSSRARDATADDEHVELGGGEFLP